MCVYLFVYSFIHLFVYLFDWLMYFTYLFISVCVCAYVCIYILHIYIYDVRAAKRSGRVWDDGQVAWHSKSKDRLGADPCRADHLIVFRISSLCIDWNKTKWRMQSKGSGIPERTVYRMYQRSWLSLLIPTKEDHLGIISLGISSLSREKWMHSLYQSTEHQRGPAG